MDKSQFRDLLRRYRDGRAHANERERVDTWYDLLKTNPKPLTESERSMLRDAIKNGIERRIGNTPKRVNHLSKHYIRSVAILLAFLAVGLLIWKNNFYQASDKPLIEYVEVFADQGKLKHILLPDSSIVWLNAGSKLRFTKPFDADSTRQVFLEYGEAFFDIARDPLRPFIVHTDDLNTRVLGTSFTIQAYPSLPDIRISVLSGQVEVSRSDRLLLGSLRRGDQLTYNKQDSTHLVKAAETHFSNAWMTGITYLSQASFAELALVFENAYNIRLKAGHTPILKQKYSIQLDRKIPTEDIIKAICALYQNNYRKEGNTITIY